MWVIATSAGEWCSIFDFVFVCQVLGRVIIIPSFLLLKFVFFGGSLGYFCVVECF